MASPKTKTEKGGIHWTTDVNKLLFIFKIHLQYLFKNRILHVFDFVCVCLRTIDFEALARWPWLALLST
jgi:hypothetical protein